MSPLNKYLQRKEREKQKELNKFINETKNLVQDVKIVPFEMIEEDGSEQVSRYNVLIREINKKFVVYDGSINRVNSTARKCIDKVVMIFIQQKTILFLSIVASITVAAIFGIITFLIKIFL